MNMIDAQTRLSGCYVTVPTQFRDDLSVDLEAIRQHVRFLINGGIETGTGVILAGGAAGDFSTMTFNERVDVAAAVVEAADGRVPVAMGAQTTSTRELVDLARAAERVGADYIQVSPPYYFPHTSDDFYEYVLAAAGAADVGIIVYNTFWTSQDVPTDLVERLSDVPNVVGLKWSMPDMGNMEFEQVISRFSRRFSIIDNQMRFVTSHMLGARAIEVHVCNYWPEWGVNIWRLLQSQHYVDAQRELVQVAMPFLALWQEMEHYTSGDGYLDKLCMELVGIGSSRCRPPTRDVRERFREKAQEMLGRSAPPVGWEAYQELSEAAVLR
jgi:dihydrodipicolinate synthase/N-acetylneuraminate lyase